MKEIRILFLMFVFCCLVTNLVCMEGKKAGSQCNEVYYGMINQLLYTSEKDLAKRIDHFAPEVKSALIEVIKEMDRSEKLDFISATIRESLGEKSVGKGRSGEKKYNQHDLVVMLDGLVNTVRSEVPAKIEKFDPELKKALIAVFENVLKPNMLLQQHVDENVAYTLNKLNFINQFLKKTD